MIVCLPVKACVGEPGGQLTPGGSWGGFPNGLGLDTAAGSRKGRLPLNRKILSIDKVSKKTVK